MTQREFFGEGAGRATQDQEAFSLLELLEQKNSCLLEFHKINMDELSRLSEGRTDNLENFYYSRELLLNAINKLDCSVSEAPARNIDPAQKKRLTDILNLKKNIVISILDQDLAIISMIDALKKEGKMPHTDKVRQKKPVRAKSSARQKGKLAIAS